MTSIRHHYENLSEKDLLDEIRFRSARSSFMVGASECMTNAEVIKACRDILNERRVRAFVASLVLASTEGREPMTEEEAAYNLHEMDADGIDIPAGLSASVFSSLWNSMI